MRVSIIETKNGQDLGSAPTDSLTQLLVSIIDAVLSMISRSGTVELPCKKVVTPTVNTPINTAFIPRVIIRGFIPSNPTANPFMAPTTTQYKSASDRAVGSPEDDLTLTINAAPVAIMASDKSIPPVSMQIV